MPIIKSIIVALFMTLIMTGCSSFPGKMSDEKLNSTKNIAVMSMLGDTFHGIHIGTTVFTNIEYDVPVPEWKIDELTEQLIINHISKNPSNHAQALKHDAGLASRFEQSLNFFSGYNYEEIINLAKQQNVDTVILIKPSTYENMPFHKPGYGFFERTTFVIKKSCVYSLFTAQVISTATGKVIGWEWGLPCATGESELAWKDSFDQYTQEEKNLLRKKTEDSVKNNVINALNEIGFK
jgi:hypothetical protein